MEDKIIWALFGLIVFYTILLFACIIVLIPRIQKTRQANLDKQLLQSQVEIQEETLKVVARELHDHIGHTIYLSQLCLETLRMEETVLAEQWDGLDGFLSQASDSLHLLLNNLSLDLIKSGELPKALAGLVRQLERAGRYAIHFEETGWYEGLPEQQEIFVFRIFQETVNNIMRHAEATRIDIHFEARAGGLRLTVRDDGKGFAVEPGYDGERGLQQGRGLRNMIDRAALIHAQLTIESQPGQGTVVQLTLPNKLKTIFDEQ